MTATEPGPIVVEVHPLAPTSGPTFALPLKDGRRLELRLTPLAGCEACADVDRGWSCACCGRGPASRLGLHHEQRAVTCMPCLATRLHTGACAHGHSPEALARHWEN